MSGHPIPSVSHPSLAMVERLAQANARPGLLIPLYRRLMSDQITPVLAYRRLVRPDDRLAESFLLESVVGGDRVGRYSFLGAQPAAQIIAYGHQVQVIDSLCSCNSRSYQSPDPLADLAKLTAEHHLVRVPGLPDFTGGWVGFAGYDTVRYLEGEKLAAMPRDDRQLPDLQMGLYRQVVIFDHVQKTVLAVTHVQPDRFESVAKAYQAGESELDALVARLETPVCPDGGLPELAVGHVDLESQAPKLPVSNMGPDGYQQAVRHIKKYIQAGDAFQVVPSQRFELSTVSDPFDIYRSLRIVNPSPYMFYLQIRGGMLIGSSPEILCRVHDGVVTNRPLAGTRRRGRDVQEDRLLERELLSDPKERAEHIMLVDLGRNDVGRVAEPGSIALSDLMTIEHYSHVMHISSTVTGKLRSGADCWDALRMALPVGTVSGAPKIRSMQIIDEVEPTKRGPYAGAVGYADFAGNMDMAIALRTMVVMPDAASCEDPPKRWKVYLQVGAGIVADSDPEAEHEETVNKAAALGKAVDLAEKAFARR